MKLATILAIALPPLFSACAGIEQTFRDANGVVNEVIDLSAEAETPTQKEPLYAIEDRVESACRPLFESANQRMTGGDVSMLTKVSVLMTSGRCRSSVDDARRELDRYRENTDAVPQVADVEKSKAF
ncbi:MAG TPA: hypothetical protein VLS27_18130, partial [Gammaproteobacteria bacterium]|nr:hypothetical protein [Gammaproteobacteria bacterium]